MRENSGFVYYVIRYSFTVIMLNILWHNGRTWDEYSSSNYSL